MKSESTPSLFTSPEILFRKSSHPSYKKTQNNHKKKIMRIYADENI